MGAIPFNNGDPNVASLALQATNVYNATLNQGVRDLAAANRRVNLIQMDAFSAIDLIIKNPGAFGFTNVTDACVVSPACVGANGQGYLFWDPVHPTARGHQLIARYAALLLSTESNDGLWRIRL
jgi:outer membrane lipase/esterase